MHIFYILTNNHKTLDQVKTAIDVEQSNIELRQVFLSEFKDLKLDNNEVVFVDHDYLMTDLLKLEDLDNMTWVLLSSEIMFHYRILSNPPIHYVNLRLPVSFIQSSIAKIVIKVNKLMEAPKSLDKVELLDMKRKRIYQAIPDILYVESYGDYSKIFSLSSDDDIECYLVSHNLKHIEELLSGQSFFRIHRSHIVNLRHLHKEQVFSDNIVTLIKGIQIPIARRRKQSLLNEIRKNLVIS